ncbi:hypothetical protein N9917_03520 [Deltaproteobacteria bacterium]|nr:hypothetical protein [Deltaproteobacteria bacterium]
MTTEERGQNILTACAGVRAKMTQQGRELAKLELHAELMVRGVDPDTIATFGYSPRREGTMSNDTLIHHKDGTTTTLLKFDLLKRRKALAG